MNSGVKSLVKFSPDLVINGNQMDPGDENDFKQCQARIVETSEQNAFAQLKRLSATQFIEHNEVPELIRDSQAA